jgi:DNA-binding IclR family transcriptional regulator
MPGRVRSIERAAAILRLLARARGSVGIGELATSLGLAKGTVHGIVRTLVDVGLVDQDPATSRYRPGVGLRHLGELPLDPNELRSLAINWADALAARTATEVRLGVLVGDVVLVVHHVFRPDDSVQVLDVGARLPVHATALGKVLLAHDPGALARATRRELVDYTGRTTVEPDALDRQLEEARRRGWTCEVEEFNRGEASIAAPIRDHGGLTVAAVAVRGTPRQICDGKGRPKATLTTKLVETAGAISREVQERR